MFSPQGEYFASGGQDGKVMVWKSNINAAKTMAEKVRNLILNHRILVIFFYIQVYPDFGDFLCLECCYRLLFDQIQYFAK